MKKKIHICSGFYYSNATSTTWILSLGKLMRLLFYKITRLLWAFAFVVAAFMACDDPGEDLFPDLDQIEENILALAGGTLITNDSIKLEIPANALPSDGLVLLGITGNELHAVPNTFFEIMGKPFTVRFPSAFILKPVHVQIPIFSDILDTTNLILLAFNGSTYFPMIYQVNETKIEITIDQIDWETPDNKFAGITSELIIFFARYKQSIPENEMGLKKIRLNSETREISYEVPQADADSKILLLIHGWTSNPEKWNDFIHWLTTNSELAFSDIWTFGYNSSRSIDQNGEILLQELEQFANGAQIDVVAHSMGGLVSRSMIENFSGADYIHQLVTLGSPHKGSPLAVFRYALGALVSEDNPDASMAYNYNTQGFRDLDTGSVFIREMKQLEQPPLPYYTLAVTNDPGQNLFSQISSDQLLPGPDDGIVAVSSAHGVKGAESPDQDVIISTPWAHMKLPEDTAVFRQVENFLLRRK